MAVGRRSTIKTLLISATFALAAGGCGSNEADATGSIPLGKIPATVVKEAQKQLPGVAFESAIEEKLKGKVAYELKGRDKKGKEQKVKISREGKLVVGK